MTHLPDERNRFYGDVVTEWIADESRMMRLKEDFSFIDGSGKKWLAPEGSLIDGASIPRFFWRVIGSPFFGHFRRASVIHDVYCVTKSEPYKKVHKMFYNAMIADGVSKRKAKAMYWAVKMGGPKWPSKLKP
jgi:hypothetical protein